MNAELLITESPILPRTEGIALMKRLLAPAQAGVEKLHDLAMQFSYSGWKELFIRYWQQQSRCEAELDAKIRELGGNPHENVSRVQSQRIDPIAELSDLIALDRALLLNALNQETHLLLMYSEARRLPMSFDLRMLLQRHHLQIHELTERLAAIYKTYSHHE